MTPLLAIPQNEAHVETLGWLVPELLSRGISVRALDLDSVFHQGIDLASVPGIETSVIEHHSEEAFYRLHPIRQIRTIRELGPAVRSHAAGADIVLVFNDGALQRVALREARRRGRQAAVLLDGMISNYRETVSLPRRALRHAGRMLAYSNIGSMFPSEIGMSPADRMFVIGTHSAEVLRRRGASAREIIATGLPRFPEEGAAGRRTPARLLYLTGAFGWHGSPHLHAAQIEDVRLLGALASEVGYRLTVRVHPRDDSRAYQPSSHAVVSAARPLRDEINDTDIVLSLASTGLLEAIAIGRVALTLSVNAPWRVFSESFAADPIFGPVRTLPDLRSELARLTGNEYLRHLLKQRSIYRRYALPGGATASRAIASSLAA